jgi:hypothetical protein
MGHTEHIMAEIATLDAAEQARLLAFVRELKAARTLTVQQREDQAKLSAALAPFRVSLAGHRFDREDANAR